MALYCRLRKRAGFDNALSRAVSVDDGKGQVTSYEYDEMDRVTKVTFDDGSPVEYAYDGDGNVVEMTDGTGTTTVAYDQRNDLVSRTTPDGVTVTYEYDGIGNLASVTDPGGTVTYSYSAANMLSAAFDPSGAAMVFSYDRDFNRTTVRYPNGVSMFSTYDEAKRLKKVSSVDDKLNVLLSFEYSYQHPTTNADTSLRQSVTDKDGNVTAFTYDALNRLTRARTTAPGGAMLRDEQYSYDGASNRISQTIYDGTATIHTFFRYNDANQLVNFNGLTTFTYDGNGNLTGSSLGAEYRYNALDQTTSIRTVGGLPVEMTYRGVGQAERISINEAGEPVIGFTHSLVGVTTEAIGGVERHYTYDDTGQVLTQRSPTGTLYVLTDGLGSTVGLADASGELVGTLAYSAYGETTEASGMAEVMPFRYAGAYLDPTGLYKLGERYYDASLGRFTQQDPIHDPLDPKQWNGYVYVGGDPVNFADPSGLCSWRPGDWGDCARSAGRAMKSAACGNNWGTGLVEALSILPDGWSEGGLPGPAATGIGLVQSSQLAYVGSKLKRPGAGFARGFSCVGAAVVGVASAADWARRRFC